MLFTNIAKSQSTTDYSSSMNNLSFSDDLNSPQSNVSSNYSNVVSTFFIPMNQQTRAPAVFEIKPLVIAHLESAFQQNFNAQTLVRPSHVSSKDFDHMLSILESIHPLTSTLINGSYSYTVTSQNEITLNLVKVEVENGKRITRRTLITSIYPHLSTNI